MNDAKALVEYSKEIAPRVREILRKKDLLKDYIEQTDAAKKYKEVTKDAKDELKAALEKDEEIVGLKDEIKELEKELKMALKGAARVSEYKPAELKAFFVARAKDTVKKVIDKGDTFEGLVDELDGDDE